MKYASRRGSARLSYIMLKMTGVFDLMAFFGVDYNHDRVLMEYDKTDMLFTNPQKQVTEDYITGRFG